MNLKYVYSIILTIFIVSCGDSNKANVIGEYHMINNGEINSFLSLTLKENGTGFLKNSEGFKYTKVNEFCTFDWTIETGEYRIKDGSYDYVSVSSLSNYAYQTFLDARWVIVDNEGGVELKALTQSENFQNVLNYRKMTGQ